MRMGIGARRRGIEEGGEEGGVLLGSLDQSIKMCIRICIPFLRVCNVSNELYDQDMHVYAESIVPHAHD